MVVMTDDTFSSGKDDIEVNLVYKRSKPSAGVLIHVYLPSTLFHMAASHNTADGVLPLITAKITQV